MAQGKSCELEVLVDINFKLPEKFATLKKVEFFPVPGEEKCRCVTPRCDCARLKEVKKMIDPRLQIAS